MRLAFGLGVRAERWVNVFAVEQPGPVVPVRNACLASPVHIPATRAMSTVRVHVAPMGCARIKHGRKLRDKLSVLLLDQDQLACIARTDIYAPLFPTSSSVRATFAMFYDILMEEHTQELKSPNRNRKCGW